MSLYTSSLLSKLIRQLNYTTFRQFCKDKPPLANTPLKELLDNAASFEDAKPQVPEDEWATLPYPEGANIKRDQGEQSLRPSIDPRETTIICFPGQGNQYVGMGKILMKHPLANDMFRMANEILGYDLKKICLHGPKSELNKTVHCQPATFVTSLAAIERLKEERPQAIDACVAVAGYSLGEITALVFAGAIPFDKGLRLVQIRAEAMQMASDMVSGGMMIVLYGPDSSLSKACIDAIEYCKTKNLEHIDCRIASYMYPHCKVVAGNTEALEFIEQHMKDYKIRRVKRVEVSGAFHTSLMLPAVESFKKALKKIKLELPVVPVYSNVDGKFYRNTDHIYRQLPKQITSAVKWEQTLHILYERKVGKYFPRTFECGPGKSLTTILKQVNAKAWDHALNIEA